MRFTINLAITLLAIVAMTACPTATHAARDSQSTRVVHVVRPGETLSGIAARYGVSSAALAAANNIVNANNIYAGMALIIPGTTASRIATTSPRPNAPSNLQSWSATPSYQRIVNPSVAGSCGSTYVVQRGDTVSRIARRCGLSTSFLLRANHLDASGRIYVGQVLMISGSAPSYRAAPTPSPASLIACTNPYIVRSGDTLFRIARACGITIADLRRWNGLTSDTILIGQSLRTSQGNLWIPIPVRTPDTRKLTPVAPYPKPMPTRQPPGFYAVPTPQIEATISRW